MFKLEDMHLGAIPPKGTGGAMHVIDQTNGGGSIYDADKTVLSASSTREAIATGARSIYVRNNGATNFMRFKFGDSSVTATVSTGFRLNVDESIKVVIPDGATHWAYIANSANVTATVVWS